MTYDKDRLPELPKGWVWTRVGELADNIHYGYTESATEEPVGPKFLRITDIQDNSVNWDSVPYCKIEKYVKEKYLLKEGDLVFARTGATVGKSFLIVGEIPEAVFASYLIRILLNRGLNKKYVYNFFQSLDYWTQISEGKLGIGQPNVNAQILSNIIVPLPPLPEQRRIVVKIEELFTRLDAGVEALRKVKAEIKRYRQAVLKHAFEGRLTEEWRKNVGATIAVAPDKGAGISPAPTENLPEGWVWVRVGDICDLINGRAFKPSEWAAKGLPIIRIQNLNNVRSNFNYCDFKVDEKYLVNNGQLLFAWSGTPGTSFGAHIWKAGKAVLNQHIFKVEIDEAHINKVFLMYLLNRNVDEYIRKAHGTAGLAHITKGKFENSPLPLPPLPEQHKIVEEIERHFSIADEGETAVDQSLKQAERLRQSILKRAFEGRLVPQDPTDEPASIFLERIKSDRRSKSNKVNSGRKKRYGEKSSGMA